MGNTFSVRFKYFFFAQNHFQIQANFGLDFGHEKEKPEAYRQYISHASPVWYCLRHHTHLLIKYFFPHPVNFNSLLEKMPVAQVVSLLNDVYTSFDKYVFTLNMRMRGYAFAVTCVYL